MEKTKCLYDKFPYETEFDANVLAVKALKEEQDRYEVILDQTLFFPEQGGQTPDQGWLSVGHGLRPATVQGPGCADSGRCDRACHRTEVGAGRSGAWTDRLGLSLFQHAAAHGRTYFFRYRAFYLWL